MTRTPIRTALLTSLAAILLAAPAARAEQFTLFIYKPPKAFAARIHPAAGESYWGAFGAFAQRYGRKHSRID